mgnify:CR=1 FL=1
MREMLSPQSALGQETAGRVMAVIRLARSFAIARLTGCVTVVDVRPLPEKLALLGVAMATSLLARSEALYSQPLLASA